MLYPLSTKFSTKLMQVATTQMPWSPLLESFNLRGRLMEQKPIALSTAEEEEGYDRALNKVKRLSRCRESAVQLKLAMTVE